MNLTNFNCINTRGQNRKVTAAAIATRGQNRKVTAAAIATRAQGSKARRVAAAFVVFFALMIIMLPAAARPVDAATTDAAYELTKFDVQANVNKDHTFDVIQTINVNLPSDLQELSFIIPQGNYKIENLKLGKNSVNAQKVGKHQYINIVDPSILTKGTHTYRIQYTIVEYQDRNSANDMFYYNVLLPDWKVPIGRLAITVQFPEDFPWNDMNYYAGQFGSSNKVSDLSYEANQEKKTVTITGSRIPENYAVTLKAQLPEGYWEGALDRSWTAYIIPGFAALILIASAILWLIFGKDPKVKRSLAVKPIEGIYPSDTGFIFENKVRVKDFITLIIYMAEKGYLAISEYHPKKYRLLRLEDPKGEEKYIRNIYNTLFEGVYEKRYLDTEEICPRMRAVMGDFAMSIEAGFSDKSMAAITISSKICRLICIMLATFAIGAIPIIREVYQYVEVPIAEPLVVMVLSSAMIMLICRSYDLKYNKDKQHYIISMLVRIAGLGIILGYELYKFWQETGLWAIALSVIPIIAGVVFFCVVMGARGKGNAELTMKLKSLRKWINNAGPKQVAPLQMDDSSYYYSLVPYALEFSSLETWAKAFRGIHIDPPSWYIDEIQGHAESNLIKRMSALDYAKNLKYFTRTIEDEYDNMLKHYHR